MALSTKQFSDNGKSRTLHVPRILSPNLALHEVEAI